MPIPGRPERGLVDQQKLHIALRALEHSRNDSAVARALGGRRVVDALNGNPVARHVYRLLCGHLVDVHGTKLPPGKHALYCEREGCRRERSVVEWLTAY